MTKSISAELVEDQDIVIDATDNAGAFDVAGDDDTDATEGCDPSDRTESPDTEGPDDVLSDDEDLDVEEPTTFTNPIISQVETKQLEVDTEELIDEVDASVIADATDDLNNDADVKVNVDADIVADTTDFMNDIDSTPVNEKSEPIADINETAPMGEPVVITNPFLDNSESNSVDILESNNDSNIEPEVELEVEAAPEVVSSDVNIVNVDRSPEAGEVGSSDDKGKIEDPEKMVIEDETLEMVQIETEEVDIDPDVNYVDDNDICNDIGNSVVSDVPGEPVAPVGEVYVDNEATENDFPSILDETTAAIDPTSTAYDFTIVSDSDGEMTDETAEGCKTIEEETGSELNIESDTQPAESAIIEPEIEPVEAAIVDDTAAAEPAEDYSAAAISATQAVPQLPSLNAEETTESPYEPNVPLDVVDINEVTTNNDSTEDAPVDSDIAGEAVDAIHEETNGISDIQIEAKELEIESEIMQKEDSDSEKAHKDDQQAEGDELMDQGADNIDKNDSSENDSSVFNQIEKDSMAPIAQATPRSPLFMDDSLAATEDQVRTAEVDSEIAPSLLDNPTLVDQSVTIPDIPSAESFSEVNISDTKEQLPAEVEQEDKWDENNSNVDTSIKADDNVEAQSETSIDEHIKHGNDQIESRVQPEMNAEEKIEPEGTTENVVESEAEILTEEPVDIIENEIDCDQEQPEASDSKRTEILRTEDDTHLDESDMADSDVIDTVELDKNDIENTNDNKVEVDTVDKEDTEESMLENENENVETQLEAETETEPETVLETKAIDDQSPESILTDTTSAITVVELEIADSAEVTASVASETNETSDLGDVTSEATEMINDSSIHSDDQQEVEPEVEKSPEVVMSNLVERCDDVEYSRREDSIGRNCRTGNRPEVKRKF